MCWLRLQRMTQVRLSTCSKLLETNFHTDLCKATKWWKYSYVYILHYIYDTLCIVYCLRLYMCMYIYIYTHTYVQIWTQTLVPNSDFFWSKINQSHHPTLPRKPEPSGNLGKSWTSPKNLGTIERSPSCFTHSKTQVFTTDHMVHWHLLRPHPIKLSPVQLSEFLRV